MTRTLVIQLMNLGSSMPVEVVISMLCTSNRVDEVVYNDSYVVPVDNAIAVGIKIFHIV